ncbi:uncharacterized protein LOC111392227 [Olea europaea var. sylvestris]|uniref:uncharacterized protein LOC111392227 n=1 Tax=Olea europaea var. sylvestris TaxID=158386 RepID=UPI000C1D33EE|nr:uncharacterized protein LOC111392227 [Olea europaea var. sylvestris]
MVVVLRFVDKSGQVKERFLGISHVTNTCTQSLKDVIDAMFSTHGLSISSLRGQGYDGASNMSSEFNGLKALILRENPHAMYVHCFAHQLQLAIVSVARRNCMLGDFFDGLAIILNLVGASYSILQELNDRFPETITELFTCISCLRLGDSFAAFDKNKLLRLAQFYPLDFNSEKLLLLRLQLDKFLLLVRMDEAFFNLNSIFCVAQKLIETGSSCYFPLVYRLLTLTLILPVATTSIERVFSGINLINSDLRNKMGDV